MVDEYLTSIEDYRELLKKLECLDKKERNLLLRYQCRSDLYFLLLFGFGRKDIEHPWLLARCKEVQKEPNGRLDLWARDHYKSTIITYAKTIQDILASHGEHPLPEWGGMEPTFGIFSHTRPIAKGFLRQIKRELGTNSVLKELFPDILWANPEKDAPKWSEDDGLVMIRKTNPKESTVEAWGLVEGQPTSKHFTVRIYDDVVTLSSVNTPEMRRKTMEAWEMSLNLGAGEHSIERYVGTRYHFSDAYRDIIKREAAIPRIYPGTEDGTPTGKAVFKSNEYLADLYRKIGPYTFSTQILLNPLADEIEGLKIEWLQYHKGSDGSDLNRYLLVDPANEKKRGSDYTAIWVVGLGADENYYVLDMVRDRLNLMERAEAVFKLHRMWRPLNVGYEHYGMQADIAYLKEKMGREHYHFQIVALGGAIPKLDRIKRLIPSLSEKRWYFPDSIFKTDYQGKVTNLVDIYINEEYRAFPVPVHDDMLDCQSRIMDSELNALWPMREVDTKDDRYQPRRERNVSPWSY